MVPHFTAVLSTLAALSSVVHGAVAAPRGLVARQAPGSYTTWGVVLKFPFKTYIDSWTLSVTVPAAPSPQKDQQISFVGLETNSLQYGIYLISYASPGKYGCKTQPGQWCVVPTYYSPTGTTQVNGTAVAVNPKDVLSYSFKQETPTTGTLGPGYRVKVTRAGTTLSQLRSNNDVGLGIGYVIGSSCAVNSQKLPQWIYTGLTYGLGLPYPNFIADSPPQTDQSSNSQPYTTNSGLTWKIDTVTLNSVQCTA